MFLLKLRRPKKKDQSNVYFSLSEFHWTGGKTTKNNAAIDAVAFAESVRRQRSGSVVVISLFFHMGELTSAIYSRTCQFPTP